MATTSHAPASSSTLKTMNSPSSSSSDSVSDSGHSSPNSSGSDSPLVSFDHSLDPADPLNVFLNTDAVKLGSGSPGDLSADDSLFSLTPPSSHDSPGTDWCASVSAPTKDASDQLWQPSDLPLFSFEGFNASGGMDFSMGFDSMLFPGDPLFSMTSPNAGPAVDLSSFTANPGQDSLQISHAPAMNARNKQQGVTSSTGIPAVAETTLNSLPNMNHTTVPPAPAQEQTLNNELMDELAARARQLVGLTMALPFNENRSGMSVATLLFRSLFSLLD